MEKPYIRDLAHKGALEKAQGLRTSVRAVEKLHINDYINDLETDPA